MSGMDPVLLKLTFLMLLGISATTSGLALTRMFFAYRAHMESKHHAEWSELMRRDPYVAVFGKWWRGPFGSSALMRSAFDASKDYGDPVIAKLKRGLRRALPWFVVSLFALTAVGFSLPGAP